MAVGTADRGHPAAAPLGFCRRRQAEPGQNPAAAWGEAMVTSELYQFCLVIIGIIGLVLQAKKK